MKYDTRKIRGEYPLNETAERYGVKLTKEGREWRACCPFHSGDNTPSFTIFHGKDRVQRFHCFGCGAQGDVIDFVMEYHGLDPKSGFAEACKIITGDASTPKAKPQRYEAESFDPYADYDVLPVPEGQAPILAGKASPELLNPKRLDAKGKPRSVVYKSVTYAHAYRNAAGELTGYVLRIDIEGRKLTPAILWGRNRKTGWQGWMHGSAPEPRQVYGADLLAENPRKQVLVVEGEKCADAGRNLTNRAVTISWLGGAKSFEKTDWSVLKGRRVVFWEDNDAEGEMTIRGGYDARGEWRRGIAEIALDEGAESVKVIPRIGDGKPKGWDIFDAIHDDKMDEGAVLAFSRARSVPWSQAEIVKRRTDLHPPVERDPAEPDHPDTRPPPQDRADAIKPQAQAKPEKTTGKASVPATRPRDGNVVSLFGNPIPKFEVEEDWRKNLIMNEDGKLVARRHTNFIWMLRGHDKIRGTFAYNEVAQDVYVVKRPPWERGDDETWRYRPANSDDTTHLISFLERTGLTPKASDIEAVLPLIAKDRSFNPVQHYLKTIKWDGVPRLIGGEDVKPFICEFFGHPVGARHTDLTAKFFTRWMVSAVARALHPGCKADCMIVLEGPQGHRKSTFLSALSTVNGISYFTDDVRDIESKEAGIAMQGKWIIEIPELDAFRRKETDAIKAWLSRTIDRFRIPYAKKAADFPRHSVIAGTMNPSGVGYLKDSTGARRFWPIPILAPIDIDRVIEERDQLWAEAVHYYRAGMQWYLTDDEARGASVITGERYEEDAWATAINDMLADAAEITVERIMAGLAIPRSQQNALTVKRVVEHLKRVGYEKRRRRKNLFGDRAIVWVRGGEIERGNEQPAPSGF